MGNFPFWWEIDGKSRKNFPSCCFPLAPEPQKSNVKAPEPKNSSVKTPEPFNSSGKAPEP